MTEPQLLAGRTVIVTGGSRGIGAGIVVRTAAAGANVVAASRVGSAPPAGPGHVHSVACDICTKDAPDRLLDVALTKFGRVDGLVNSAGLIYFMKPWEHTDDQWDELFETNLTAPFRLSQRLALHWVDNDADGVIVNICSVDSKIVFPEQAGYAATKGGLLGLTRAMALELGPQKIRVVALGPGAIDTPMTGPWRDQTEPKIPLRRLGTPEEIGDVTAFLLSDLARYMTGEIVYVDGGYLLQ